MTDWKRLVQERLKTLHLKATGESDLTDELAQHLEDHYRELRSGGASDLRTGREIVDGGLFQAKIGVALLSAFGLLARGPASIGLYGIMAHSVNQRKREIGLRMALGAAPASVLRLILKQGISLVLTGVVIGFAAALLVGRLLSGMLYGVSASDPLSGNGVPGGRAVSVLFACTLGQPRRSISGIARGLNQIRSHGRAP